MFELIAILIALAVIRGEASAFPLRTDPPPREWKTEEMNEGLPYRWEKGTVHLLAWEVIEDRSALDQSQLTQILVLKRFDEPTEKGKHHWVLAHLYGYPKDKKRPWQREMLHLPPVFPGEKMPDLSDAEIFGHEFYDELPNDEEIDVFLREVGWTPELGPHESFTIADDKVITVHHQSTLITGGVDPVRWKKLFGRKMATNLFPELAVPARK